MFWVNTLKNVFWKVSNKLDSFGNSNHILSGVYDYIKTIGADSYLNLTRIFKIDNEDATTRPKKVNAAFVILVRNNELHEMKKSMKRIEDRFNKNYLYPYVFLNDVEFTEEFKIGVQAMTNAKVEFGTIENRDGKVHWGYPDSIDLELAATRREEMQAAGVMYGESESYRHMCRFNSGFFYRHKLLDKYEYYWRIEPGIDYSCDIEYDPFKYMKDRNIKYGYTIGLYEYENTIPSLWGAVKAFIKKHPEHISTANSIKWLSKDGGKTYNGCHFWSNFEIGSLSFFRSKAYTDYFDYLDSTGGFFYERWGDAPVHSIAAALFLNQTQIHWFKDIGYKHEPWENCPQDNVKCYCDPQHSSIHHYYAVCGKNFVEGNHTLPVADFLKNI
ncbi:Glycolipid 2-alpha-mannosyltransferase 2 [Zancudomyces culisetae]|uniref:Glycolipid 2-alpha-mannosyltransferase 2 n=1 Tax=Zancudomyces culisetae TaxID=1213189 RepID=A0A1R1PK21_ZANCU|nr:Glycolipid 2-alpha-mannosyltransferase 2 [Zancudomyces culisetae]|eukprot:OMH81304.1 Glycolipid 2-alpha-mannosyltransferase 2 [Zancudomyces culisetae]